MNKNSAQTPIDRSKLKSFRDITRLTEKKMPQSPRRNSIPRLPPNLLVKKIQEQSYEYNQPGTAQVPKCIIKRRQPNFKILQVRRTKSSNIRGRRTLFVLHQYEQPIYSAKYKPTKFSDYIPIYSGGDPHFKDKPKAVLLIANKNCDFSLRNDNKLGQELLTLQFRRFNREGVHPRHLTAFFFNQHTNIPHKLGNADPEYRDDGWSVDLNTNDAMSSIKNCKLESDDHQPFAYIRKTLNETLEIEAREEIDNISVFAFGISSFLCKK